MKQYNHRRSISYICSLFISIISLLLLTGCSKDEILGEYWELRIEIKGDQISSQLNRNMYYVDISSEGGDMTLTPSKDSEEDIMRCKEILVNDISTGYEDPNFREPPYPYGGKPVMTGDWGEMKYTSAKSPMIFSIHIAPNPDDEPRTIKVRFQGRTDEKFLIISQTPKADF